jgi:uncharacterized membrane protein YdjX (TVP38/TMEM64 family)
MTTDAPAESSGNKFATTLIVIVTLVVAAGIVYYIGENQDAVASFIRAMGALGPIVSITLFGLLGLSPVPSEVLSIIVGVVYGPLWGTLISFSGYMIASWIEYYVGGGLAKMTDFEERRQHMPFGLGRFPANSPLFLIFTRVIPGYGPKMVGIVAGMYKVSLWRFTWTGAIPAMLGSAVFAIGGNQLVNLIWGTP